MAHMLSRRSFVRGVVAAGAAARTTSILWPRPGEAAPENTIIYIHGLENKPPPATKEEWCYQALAEGLKRNTGQTLQANFGLAYWADLRYERPDDIATMDERYEPAAGSGGADECRQSDTVSAGPVRTPAQIIRHPRKHTISSATPSSNPLYE